MIKYFSFQEHTIDNNIIIKNEKILDEKKYTDYYGWIKTHITNGYEYFIDVDKYVKFYGSFKIVYFKEVYDRLLLQERNKKLDTL